MIEDQGELPHRIRLEVFKTDHVETISKKVSARTKPRHNVFVPHVPMHTACVLAQELGLRANPLPTSDQVMIVRDENVSAIAHQVDDTRKPTERRPEEGMCLEDARRR